MQYIYHVQMTPDQVDAFDEKSYDFGIDDYIWFEDENQTILTENDKVPGDLEAILAELDVEFETETRE